MLDEGDEPDWASAGDDQRPAREIIADYRAAIESSNRAIVQVADLDAPSARELDGRAQSLRWTIAHMRSETARHAGHANILRELVDGTTGR